MHHKNELKKIIEQLPSDKMDDLLQYAKNLVSNSEKVITSDFEDAYKITKTKYNKTLKNLVKRW